MSCNCNGRILISCCPETEAVAYTFQNANLTGIGVLDGVTDTEVSFRGLVSDSAALTITLNATDNTLVFDFNDALLVADIPDATTTQRGILETATDAEAIAKAALDKTLTPSNLAALGASDTFAGLVELATNAEAITGTSTTLALTPANLTAVAATLEQTATWADAVARAALVPAFAGQLGVQLDTDIAYLATGTAAGNFSLPLLVLDTTNNVTASATTITLGDTFTFTGASQFILEAPARIDGTFNFDSGARIYDDNAIVPASSVLTTSSTAGQFNSSLISTFVSSANTQTGYTAFSNPATLRTCDTATVTLQQLAQLVGTLIADLKAVLLPAT